MPRTDFLFPTFAGGLIDGLANDTAPQGGLRVCKDVDFANAPVGGITLRHPTIIRPLSGDYPDEFGLPDVNFNPIWLFRFRGYDNDIWPFLLLAYNQAYAINRDLNKRSRMFPLEYPVNSKYAVFNENKVYFIGGIFPTVLEQNSSNIFVKEMGFQTPLDFNYNVKATGGALPVIGDYRYQLILTDENGHRSAPRPFEDAYHVTWPHGGNPDQYVELGHDTDTPANDNPLPICRGKHKYLYRTKNSASPNDPDNFPVFYLVDVLNGADTEYDDNVIDDTLVTHEVMPEGDGLPPQNLAFAAVNNGIMWGFTEESSVLRYTPQFDYENWPEINAIPIGDPDYLIALQSLGDRLVIFKKNKIYAFWGTNIGNFDYRQMSNIHGTKHPKTIQALDENRMIFMDSQRRIVKYEGGAFTEISKTIKFPKSTKYWSSLFKDYYVLWLYDNVGVSYPRQWGELPIPTLGDDDGDDPPIPPFDDAVPPDGYEPRQPGDPEDPDLPEDPEDPPPEGWEPPDEPWDILAFAYHIPTGVWTRWDNIQAKIPEQPNRPLDNLTFWNGSGVEVFGNAYHDDFSQHGDFEIRTLNTDCGLPDQKKSFKEIELYFEYLSDRAFDGAIGQLELIVDDGEDTDAVWQQTITYDTSSPVNRLRYRISGGKNGRRASLRFIGNQYMRQFALMQARLFWEPRGTPNRG